MKFSWPEHEWSRDLRCVHCGVTTQEAQRAQLETKGVGPCQIRFRKWLEKFGDDDIYHIP